MFRKHFNASTIIAIVALVFAMTGGAYAASKYLITSTKQISPKVLKALKGKTGPAGPEGKAGAQGPAGSAGKGERGEKGEPGASGTKGKDGVSVTSSVEPKGANCAEGGSKFVASNGATYACNGKEGSPWTAGGTLPLGKTETGAWFAESSAGQAIHFAVSFPIRLPSVIAAAHIHFVTVAQVEDSEQKTGSNEIPAGCAGTAEAPEAEAGNLCVFEGSMEIGAFTSGAGFIFPAGSATEKGAGTTGAFAAHHTEAANKTYVGTWAVTAE